MYPFTLGNPGNASRISPGIPAMPTYPSAWNPGDARTMSWLPHYALPLVAVDYVPIVQKMDEQDQR